MSTSGMPSYYFWISQAQRYQEVYDREEKNEESSVY